MRRVLLAGASKSLVLDEDAAPPRPGPAEALVRSLVVGVDGTDEEVAAGVHGETPPGGTMTLGHEALGEVVEAPRGSGLAGGDRVVPLVRRPCDHCVACLRGHAEHCLSGDFTEHGIKALDGFLQDAWTEAPASLVPVPRGLGEAAVLTEPMSVVVKALEEARRVQARLPWFEDEGGFRGKRALVAGIGSLGSLAALLLASEGLDVVAVDRGPDDAAPARLLARLDVAHANAEETPLPDLAAEVGGFDLVVEATGAPKVALDGVLALRRGGIAVLLGVPAARPPQTFAADDVMRALVTGGRVALGSVNSGRAHYEEAVRRLLELGARWGADLLDDLITTRYAPAEYEEALRGGSGPDVVKKVIAWSR